MSSPTLRAAKLNLQRGERSLVSNLEFELQAGQVLRVLGENGAGKTTLLATLVGLLPKGDSTLQGFESLNCIYIGHKLSLFAELNVLENVRFYAKLDAYAGAGDSKAEVDEQTILQALDYVGLSEHIWQRAGRLSAGQKRRVLFARLWLDAQQTNCTKKLWVLDEPMTALDKTFVAQFKVLAHQFLDKGGRVIFTSHQNFFDDSFTQSERYKTLDLSLFSIKIDSDNHDSDNDDSDVESKVGIERETCDDVVAH